MQLMLVRTPRQLAHALKDIVAALRVLHSNGYCHGDLRWENVMFFPGGTGRFLEDGHWKVSSSSSCTFFTDFRTYIFAVYSHTPPNLHNLHDQLVDLDLASSVTEPPSLGPVGDLTLSNDISKLQLMIDDRVPIVSSASHRVLRLDNLPCRSALELAGCPVWTNWLGELSD